MSLTAPDIKQIREAIEAVTEPSFTAIKSDLEALREDFAGLTTSVDAFLRIVRRHEEEWLVLRAQHARMRDLLIKKGIASEEELAIN